MQNSHKINILLMSVFCQNLTYFYIKFLGAKLHTHCIVSLSTGNNVIMKDV